MSQPLDLVLDHQLTALQFTDFQVVYGGMHERFVQFVFQYFVLAFQFDQMRLYCHAAFSSVGLTSDSISTGTKECTQASESVDGYRQNAALMFSKLSVTN